MTSLLGVHDREGRHIPPPGGWCLDTIALSENPSPPDYIALRGDINWLVRLSWGYGSTGTFPLAIRMDQYIEAALLYAVQSNGVYGFILGNEPNGQWERPDGVVITPQYAADLFVRTRNAIKSMRSAIKVMPPPLAPYHDSPMDWLVYLKQMYQEIERLGGEPDGIPIHAYTRSSNPDDISSTEKMGAPLVGQFRGFRTYRDVLRAIPQRFSQTPAYITEFDENEGWEDKNTGIFKAAVKEIKDYNSQAAGSKVHSLIAFRWLGPPEVENVFDWEMRNKPQLLEDFRSAIAEAELGTRTTAFIPVVTSPTFVGVTPPVQQFQRSIEQDALNYGVRVLPFDYSNLKDGDWVWIAERVERLHEKEGEGRHHFYFETVDENGNRLTGIPIKVWWPTDEEIVKSEAKPGEPWSANKPFSPGKNAFSATVLNTRASDTVTGAGMGEDYTEGFNANVHASITVRFVRRTYKKEAIPVMPSLPETPKPAMPTLVHPVMDSAYRNITQVFGVNRSRYSHFKVDGVPLLGHNGVDYGTPIGTAIGAVAAGRVVEVADEGNKGYGRYIKLSHPWGESLYAHLNSATVTVGQSVAAGQLLGSSGNTGNSTGPHLHFGLRVAPFNRRDGWGGYTNPLPYLTQAAETPSAPLSPIPVSSYDIVVALKKAATEVGIEWQLLASLAWAESSFNPNADSGVARGLLQITTPTWEEWARKVGLPIDAEGRVGDIWNAEQNAKVGAAYLMFLSLYYNGNLYKALLAYNAGLGNVDRGFVPAETKEFANEVLHGRDLLKAVGVQ
jgi:murein DD-endopeptidase MepM/ murein hydrolase activator NlpD